MDTEDTIYKKLRQPFTIDKVEWLVVSAGIDPNNGNPFVQAAPFVDARAVQDRLDDVLGFMNWDLLQQEIVTPQGLGFKAGIRLRIGDKVSEKWDGASATRFDPIKGGMSSALKRAASLCGIGRYLYSVPMVFTECQIIEGPWQAENNLYVINDDGVIATYIDWKTPELPKWAVPASEFQSFYDWFDTCKSMAQFNEINKNINTALQINSASPAEYENLHKKAQECRERLQAERNKVIADKERQMQDKFKSEISIFKSLPSQVAVNKRCKEAIENLKNFALKIELETSVTPFLDATRKERDKRINELKQNRKGRK